jgi:hypothetical protein
VLSSSKLIALCAASAILLWVAGVLYFLWVIEGLVDGVFDEILLLLGA